MQKGKNAKGKERKQKKPKRGKERERERKRKDSNKSKTEIFCQGSRPQPRKFVAIPGQVLKGIFKSWKAEKKF